MNAAQTRCQLWPFNLLKRSVSRDPVSDWISVNSRSSRKLREVPEYRAVVARAQDRLWQPFFVAIASAVKKRRAWLGEMRVNT